MTIPLLTPLGLVSAAVAVGASTPNPGVVGSLIWSTTAVAPLVWNGSTWAAIGGGGGGFTNTVLALAPGANETDWTLTGKTSYTTVRATPADTSFIGGFAGGASGDVLHVINVSASGLLWFVHEGSTTTAANRLDLARAGVLLLPGHAISFVYDATAARWVQTALTQAVHEPTAKGLLVLPNAAAVVSTGLGATSTTATLSAVALSGTPTNDFTEDQAVQITNATANGSSDVRANALHYMRGATTGRQGLLFTARVRFTALGATGGVAAMMTASTAAITTQPRATNNTMGLGAHGGETTLRVWSRDGAAATAVDLGANFPVPSATAAYDFALFAPSNVAAVRYMVRRLDSEQRASGNITANLISNTQALGPRVGIMVGGTAAASTMQFTRFQVRSVS